MRRPPARKRPRVAQLAEFEESGQAGEQAREEASPEANDRP